MVTLSIDAWPKCPKHNEIEITVRYQPLREDITYMPQTSNISHTLVENKTDHSDVVGASPVTGASNKSSFSILTPGFNVLGKDRCKVRREIFKFWDLVQLILEVWWYFSHRPCLTIDWRWALMTENVEMLGCSKNTEFFYICLFHVHTLWEEKGKTYHTVSPLRQHTEWLDTIHAFQQTFFCCHKSRPGCRYKRSPWLMGWPSYQGL